MIQLSDAISFPHPLSNDQHDVLAIGGDLSIERLLLAYHYGIFPWFAEGDPLMWWSPHIRYVLPPDQVKISKSMRNVINRGIYRHTFDQAFDQVIVACADVKRKGQEGASGWLTEEMIDSYTQLHKLGHAHSVEVWDEDDNLVGGLYGIAIGKCFFGESMFARASNASKFGFIALCKHLHELGYVIIDGQMPNNHLKSLGFGGLDREDFIGFLRTNFFMETEF